MAGIQTRNERDDDDEIVPLVVVQGTGAIDEIERDASGRLVSWREGGTATHVVTRDANGKIQAVS